MPVKGSSLSPAFKMREVFFAVDYGMYAFGTGMSLESPKT